MTEVLIKSVSPYAEYDGAIFSYKVTCILNNRRELIFLDEKPYDLTELIHQKVFIELTTSYIGEDMRCKYPFEGEIEYIDSIGKYFFISDYLKVVVPKEILKYSNIKLNEKKEYCFDDFILNRLDK